MAPEREPLLDRYRLEKRLGAGGWGGLVGLGREARAGGGSQAHAPRRRRRRIVREARAAARLNHPGIVGLYELAADDDDLYLVSELVRGRTLADLERERALSDRDVARSAPPSARRSSTRTHAG